MRRRPATVLLAVLLAALALAACGDDAPDLGDERADQVRTAATGAGLSAEVADALALAARAETATFQVAYAGSGGARVVYSQRGGDRRLDVLQGDLVIESRVLRDGVAYRCALGTAPGTEDELQCQRAAGAINAPGSFTPEALEDFAEAVATAKDTLAVTVERRSLAGVDATCIVATPKAGTELDGDDGGTSELCLSPEGAQLLVDVGEDANRLVADEYRTDVPTGTFDVER